MILKNRLLFLPVAALLLTGCAEKFNPAQARPLIEQHLPEEVEMQTLFLLGKNLELSFDEDAAKLSPETEGRMIKNIHDELLRNYGNAQVTSVTYRIEQKTARTINGLNCKRESGCWTPFLSLPEGDDPFAFHDVQPTFEKMIAASDLIVLANFADGTYRTADVIKGDPSLKGKPLHIPPESETTYDFAGPGRYLLYLQSIPPDPKHPDLPRHVITGGWSGKFKLEGRPKGYGHDPVRAIAEEMTDQEFIEFVKRKT